MQERDFAELEIAISGPAGLAHVFWADPIEGVAVREELPRSMPSYDDLHQCILLIGEAGAASLAWVKVADALKRLFGKYPELKQRVRLRVRFGIRIGRDNLTSLTELGCEVEFVREPVVSFEATDPLPAPLRQSKATTDDPSA